jgi:uncharacterized membrane protein YphA (DoxX/SURF4 family)
MESIFPWLHHQSALSLILRLILGILFLFQGIDKVFNLGLKKVANTFQYELGTKKIPIWILYVTGFYTSYIELLGGLLLIAGLFKTYVLYLLGIDLILVTIAFSIIYPLWDMKFVWPRLLLLAILLYLPPAWDNCSFDSMLDFK